MDHMFGQVLGHWSMCWRNGILASAPGATVLNQPYAAPYTTFHVSVPTRKCARHRSPVQVEIHPLDFTTNCEKIRFYCWDTGKRSLVALGMDAIMTCMPDPSALSIHGQCAIIMFDVTSRLTYKNVPTWHGDLCRVCENIPIVLCGNKVDVKNRQVEAKQVTFQGRTLQCYEISAKSNYNFEKPFLYLARKLAGDANIHFVEVVALKPPEVTFNLAMQQRDCRHETGLAAAAAQPLPDDDDHLIE